MARRIFALIFLLTVGNLALCQDWENPLFMKIREVIEKQDAVLMKQEAALSQLKAMQEELEHVKGNIQEIQEKQDHVEGKLQDFHHELRHVKGAVNNNQDSLQNISVKLETLEEIHQGTKGCLGREDLEHFKNISSSVQQELESSLRQEISGVISLLETGGIDECSEGSHNCSYHASCIDKFVGNSCLCLPGFAGDGSHCEDIDECAQGKAECSPQATCRNSLGSYSCSCNPPFEGDGRTCDIDECAQGRDECSPHATCRNSVGSYSCSCNPPFKGDGRSCNCPSGFAQKGSNCEVPEFCRRPAEVLEGLGCVKLVREKKSFEEMKTFCQLAGGRLLQDFTLASIQQVGDAFGYYSRWAGLQEGKWLESGLLPEEELWLEGSRGSVPSRRRRLCGFLDYESSSDLYKVGQRDCSVQRSGYCQFLTPQK